MMNRRTKAIFTAVALGIILTSCLSMSVGAGRWYTSKSTVTELENALNENSAFGEEEAAQLSEYMAVGQAIDLVFTLFLYACPAAFVGAALGLIGGVFWYRRQSALNNTDLTAGPEA